MKRLIQSIRGGWRFAGPVLLLIVLALAAACQRPSNPQAASSPPVLRILSPAAGSYYPHIVTVSGTVVAGVQGKASDAVTSVVYSVGGADGAMSESTAIHGRVTPVANGSFSLSFPTDGLRGQLTVTISALAESGAATTRSLMLRDHDQGPIIVLSSPAENSSYTNAVTVSGAVRDWVDPTGSANVAFLQYLVVPQARLAGYPDDRIPSGWTPIHFGADGSFSTTIDTSAYHRNIVIQLWAEDRNGRKSSITRILAPEAEGPVLAIMSPSQRTFTGDSVLVSGSAVSRAGDPEDVPKSVRWIVADGASGVTDVHDGRFLFTAPIGSDDSTVHLTLIGQSSRGASSTISVDLTYLPPPPLFAGKPRPPIAAPNPAIAIAAPAQPSLPRRPQPAPEPATIQKAATQALVPSKVTAIPAPSLGPLTEGGPEPLKPAGPAEVAVAPNAATRPPQGATPPPPTEIAPPVQSGRRPRGVAQSATASGTPAATAAPQSVTVPEVVAAKPAPQPAVQPGPQPAVQPVVQPPVKPAPTVTAPERPASPAPPPEVAHQAPSARKPSGAAQSATAAGTLAATASPQSVTRPEPPLATRHQVPPAPRGPLLAVTITKPGPRSFYRSEMYVEGKVTDRSKGGLQAITTFTYQVADDPSLSGDIFWDFIDGTFWFSIGTSGLTGTHEVIVTAKDSDGNTAVQHLTFYDGNTRPDISLIGPADQSLYGTRIWIHGRIVDPSEDLGQPRGIRDATYNISPADFLSTFQGYQGKLRLSGDGSYSLLVLTGELKGAQQVEISATSVNGNTATTTVNLDQGTNEVPSFAATAGNGSTTLTWNREPLVASYDLYYSNDGMVPGPTHGSVITDVGSPYTVPNLINGVRYSFRLAVNASRVTPGEDVRGRQPVTGAPEEYQVIGKSRMAPGVSEITLYSAPTNSIPLAPDTLQPSVRGEYGKLQLTWNAIPGTHDFSVLRSSAESGPFLEIAKVAGDQQYTDQSVQYGRPYYYRISPSYPGSIESSATSGRTTSLPPSPFLQTGAVAGASARYVALVGDYAVLAERNAIKVVDISNVQAPAVVGTVVVPGAESLDTDGTTVFAADGSRGVKMIDITDPRNPRLTGSWPTGGAVDVAVVGHGNSREVYIACGDGGLKVLDGSGGADAVVRTLSHEPTTSVQVTHGDVQLLCAGGPSGFAVYSLDTPATPQVEFRDDSGPVQSIATYDGFGKSIAVAVGETGMRVYDLHDPLHPVVDGVVPGASGSAVSVADTADAQVYAFIVRNGATVASYDLTNPAEPTLFDSFPSDGVRSVQVARNLAGRQYAYVASTTGMKILDVFNLGQSLRISGTLTPGRPLDVAVLARAGNPAVAFVADTGKEVSAFSVADPFTVSRRSLIGLIPAADARSIAIGNGPTGAPTLYVADGTSGVKFYDVSRIVEASAASSADSTSGRSPLSAKLIGGFNTDGLVRSVAPGADPRYIYLADAKAGLIELDVSNPEQPEQVAVLSTPDPRQVVATRQYAYIADFSQGLVITDIRNPAKLVKVGSVPGLSATSLALYSARNGRQYACVLGLSGVSIIDVTDPAHARLVSRYPTDSAARVHVAGSYLYVADGFRGLTVLDISNPAEPRKVSTSDLQYASAVDVAGDFAFVADPQGLNVVQILIPSWITEGRIAH